MVYARRADRDRHEQRAVAAVSQQFDANLPVRSDEDFDLILTVREPWRVTHSRTLRYDRSWNMQAETPVTRSMFACGFVITPNQNM